MNQLHIDIETYSSIDIKTSGVYKYCESIDFEILMVAYAHNDEEIKVVDLAQGEKLPQRFLDLLHDPEVEKHAHNANFERICFRQYGHDIPIEQWYCSAVKAAYMGLPLSLTGVSKALELKEFGKSSTGSALIKKFSIPQKPSKRNGFKNRFFPSDDPQAWEEFKQYCKQDVVAEREIGRRLNNYEINAYERANYILDQKINDTGVLVDLEFAQKAGDIDDSFSEILKSRMKELTQLDNPNSPKQLKDWLFEKTKKEIQSLSKDLIPEIIESCEDETVREVLELRIKASRTSTKKYNAMHNCACDDHRARGLFQFYGANRTGRWSGRLVQLQNLRRNDTISNPEEVRELISSSTLDDILLVYDDVSDVISQLIRTAFVPEHGKIFLVADFSAIEARVLSWLANEQWRMDVFASHGKIYEASAAVMFDVPFESVTRDSEYRDKAKTAELALGYQGGLGAMTRMGGEAMGLSQSEMKEIVRKWRLKSPSIVRFWNDMDSAVKKAYVARKRIETNYRGIFVDYDGTTLRIHLPSGRWLSYWNPSMTTNKFGTLALQYKGIDQTTGRFLNIDTYGGKIVENITQAVARDVLAYSMNRLDQEGFNLIMHVHDEVITEEEESNKVQTLERMCEIMGEEIPWAPGLVLRADGFKTKFYKKD